MVLRWVHRISQENHSIKAKAFLRWQSQPGLSSSVAHRVEATSAPTGNTRISTVALKQASRVQILSPQTLSLPSCFLFFCFYGFMRERENKHTSSHKHGEGKGEEEERERERKRALEPDSISSWLCAKHEPHVGLESTTLISSPEMKPRVDA